MPKGPIAGPGNAGTLKGGKGGTLKAPKGRGMKRG